MLRNVRILFLPLVARQNRRAKWEALGLNTRPTAAIMDPTCPMGAIHLEVANGIP